MTVEINTIEKCYRELLKGGREVLRLFDGNPNHHGFHFPREILTKAYASFFAKGKYEPDPKGSLRARESIAQYYASCRMKVEPDHILLTPGTSESFFYLFSLLAKPGENILTPNPAYPLFDHIAELARIELRHYPLVEEKGWGIDLEKLSSQIDSQTRAIVLISPNNPTGAVVTAEEFEAIAMIARRENLAIISDEVFGEFIFCNENYPRVGAGFPRPDAETAPLLFTLNGISKMFALPALKLGWIAVTGDKKKVTVAVDRLETMADTFLSTHTPIQEALPRLFQEGRNFVKQYRQEVEARRNLAVKILRQSDKIRFVEPQGGFYLMAEVSDRPPSPSLAKEGVKGEVWHFRTEEDFIINLMKETGVFVHPGYFFDYEKGVHFVISFLAEQKVLKQGLARVVEFIENL
ncbi:MAG: pyridoxal phosphate-dependent aminotransferase [Deltaproteobacteria bacterium]|nr:pyridoxal phosphate-dependent aminotransferase [Deltaproteobacteria bacterium]